MDDERPYQPQQQISALEVIVILGLVLLIAIAWIIHIHWEDVVIGFWVVVSMGFVLGVLFILRQSGVPNPFNRYRWNSWRMERAVNRVRGGRDDSELSEWEIEFIDKIQNHYRDKIGGLYS